MAFKLLSICIVFIFLGGCDPSESVPGGSYSVKSDCQGFSSSGTLELKSNLIFNDEGEGDYTIEGATDYGFPSDEFRIMGPHLIQSANEDRICKTVIFEKSTYFAMYACMDISEAEMLCTIFLEKS